jgi:hypothetical protein
LTCADSSLKPKNEPNPISWTLRFKRGKHTILLLVDPLTPFSSIKADLLDTLRERYPTGLSNSTSPTLTLIPDSVKDVFLGIPVDPLEPGEGWTELSTNQGDIIESPKSLALKDGAAIAFAFREGEGKKSGYEFMVEWSNYDELYGEGEEGIPTDGIQEDI